jgi:hypothetical protein
MAGHVSFVPKGDVSKCSMAVLRSSWCTTISHRSRRRALYTQEVNKRNVEATPYPAVLKIKSTSVGLTISASCPQSPWGGW